DLSLAVIILKLAVDSLEMAKARLAFTTSGHQPSCNHGAGNIFLFSQLLSRKLAPLLFALVRICLAFEFLSKRIDSEIDQLLHLFTSDRYLVIQFFTHVSLSYTVICFLPV